MSGHSKFKTIKHRKNLQDAKRSKVFVRIGKEIQVAVQKGGNDPSTNPALRLALMKAKKHNMPKSNYLKILEKAKHNPAHYDEYSFEGYVADGVAVLIFCLSDNHNRITSEIKSLFKKANGALGGPNSVAYLFEHIGLLVADVKDVADFQADALLEKLLSEYDLVDFACDDGLVTIKTKPNDLEAVRGVLAEAQLDTLQTHQTLYLAKDQIALNEKQKVVLTHLSEALDDNEDVINYYYNADFIVSTNDDE